jgi:hypothetical protein
MLQNFLNAALGYWGTKVAEKSKWRHHLCAQTSRR